MIRVRSNSSKFKNTGLGGLVHLSVGTYVYKKSQKAMRCHSRKILSLCYLAEWLFSFAKNVLCSFSITLLRKTRGLDRAA